MNTLADSGCTQGQRFVARLLSRPPVVPPGSRYRYSNAGIAVAYAMAEQAAGQVWEELSRERLFCPLRMESASIGFPIDAAAEQPWGHREGAAGPVPIPGDFRASPPLSSPQAASP